MKQWLPFVLCYRQRDWVIETLNSLPGVATLVRMQPLLTSLILARNPLGLGRTHWISERLNEYLFINIYNSLLYCWQNKNLREWEGSDCLFSSKVPIMTMAVHESTLSNVLYSVSTPDPWTFCYLIFPCHWVTCGAHPHWDSQTCVCLKGSCWAWIIPSQQKATSLVFAQNIPSVP